MGGIDMAHPNADITRRAYEAFRAGDMQTLGDLVAEDVVWHVSGTSAISGTYKGKEETFAYFRALGERSGGTFSFDVHDIVANDDHTVGLIAVHGERDGRKLDDTVVMVFHFDDGRVTSQWSFSYDQQASSEFWG